MTSRWHAAFWIIGFFLLIALLRFYGCNMPLISSDEQKMSVCAKANMMARRLADGRVVCVAR
jgi:hypothetical protein